MRRNFWHDKPRVWFDSWRGAAIGCAIPAVAVAVAFGVAFLVWRYLG